MLRILYKLPYKSPELKYPKKDPERKNCYDRSTDYKF